VSFFMGDTSYVKPTPVLLSRNKVGEHSLDLRHSI
jgi:hypothetical protein